MRAFCGWVLLTCVCFFPHMPSVLGQRNHLILDSSMFHDEAEQVIASLDDMEQQINNDASSTLTSITAPIGESGSLQTIQDRMLNAQKLTVAKQKQITKLEDQIAANTIQIESLEKAALDRVDTSVISSALAYATTMESSYAEASKALAGITDTFKVFDLGTGGDLTTALTDLSRLMQERVVVETRAIDQISSIGNGTSPAVLNATIAQLTDQNIELAQNDTAAHLDLVNSQSELRSLVAQLHVAHVAKLFDQSFDAEERPFRNIRAAAIKKLNYGLSRIHDILNETDVMVNKDVAVQVVRKDDLLLRPTEHQPLFRDASLGSCEHFCYLFSSASHRITSSAPLAFGTSSLSFAVFLRSSRQQKDAVLFSMSDSTRMLTKAASSSAAAATPTYEGPDFSYMVVASSNGSLIQVVINGNPTVVAELPGTGVFDSEWHVVVVTWAAQGGEVSCFVDGLFRSRHWGVGVQLALKPGGSMVLGNLPPHWGQSDALQGYIGEMRDAMVVLGTLGPQDVVDFSHRRSYNKRSPFVHWNLDQQEGNSIVDSGSLNVNATTYGGAWIGVLTQDGLPVTEFTTVSPSITCSATLSNDDLTVLRTILQGPQGIVSAAANPTSPIAHVPSDSFVNPFVSRPRQQENN
eukprot:c14886_g1_i1.p1 GENE.c14886_g1_i1~~c14886_g1_i1.p1  ORF type:complete len:636 (-),score=165.83 c14886_g1_i1:107-2014(-)